MDAGRPDHVPLYWRLLRLHHLRPSAWQRAVLVEGSLVVAAVLVLADVASAWTMLLLPAAVSLVVKGNDLLVGLLHRSDPAARQSSTVDYIRTGTPPAGGNTTAPPAQRGRRPGVEGR